MQVNRKFLAFCRTIHIYLTMLGLGVMLLFGATGFTINHEDWFGATTPHITQASGETSRDLIAKKDGLQIVEHLRNTFHITGAMTSFEELEEKFAIGFKDPGRLWEVEIDKATGRTDVHIESFNAFAIINNLHRGRYSGEAWSWVIDISSILIVIACFTGVVLWMVMPKRRKIGLAAMLLGTIGTIVIYALLVPGSDETRGVPTGGDATEKLAQKP